MESYSLQQPLTPAQVTLLCESAFGSGAHVESAVELGGGEYNTTYLIRLAGAQPVILRVAPPPGMRLFWHETALMRKELAMQPYFAPIAPLMPRTVMADFTLQLIDRDYMFQTYMPGEPWSEVEGELTPEQDELLWRQFARIARTIHAVEGEGFGYPHPGARFPSWRLTVLDFIDRVTDDLAEAALDTSGLSVLRRATEGNRAAFDQIVRPRLTHGDLWPFNMLIRRGADGPAIVAVIDADRAWWCDPMADWTAHLFKIKTSPRASRNQTIFWDEYGPRPHDAAAQLRALVYDGMHTAAILASTTRRGQDKIAAEAAVRLRGIVATLIGEGH